MRYQKNYGWSSLIVRRRSLRKNMTTAERVLWREIKGKKVEGLLFRRQHGIKNYIADFCHRPSKTVIEIDGSVHLKKEQEKFDIRRTSDLKDLGYSVIRFKNTEVLNDCSSVIRKILKHIQNKPNPLLPKERKSSSRAEEEVSIAKPTT